MTVLVLKATSITTVLKLVSNGTNYNDGNDNITNNGNNNNGKEK